jgi:hypothetical protein
MLIRPPICEIVRATVTAPATLAMNPYFIWRDQMATYTCDKCNMAVNATCAHCDAPLENHTLTKPDGSTVQVSQCPNDHGKIKSPLCCGQDMSCSI